MFKEIDSTFVKYLDLDLKNFKKLVVYFVPVSFVLIFLAVYFLAVPPFGNADEVQHFWRICTKIYPESEYQRIEKDFLGFMKEGNWFRATMGNQSGSVPVLFEDNEFFKKHHGGSWLEIIPDTLFHSLYTRILGKYKTRDLKTLLLIGRFLSLFLSLGTVWLALFYFQYKFQLDLKLFFPLLLIPQFLVLGTSLNYDVLFIFCSTLFFVSLFMLKDKPSVKWIMFLIAGMMGAFLTKKAGWLWILFGCLALLFFTRKIRWQSVAWLFLNLVMSLVIFSWLNWLFPNLFFKLNSQLFEGIARALEVSSQGQAAVSFGDFIGLMGKSFYLFFGWMAFRIENVFYWIFFLFGLAFLIGNFMKWRVKGNRRIFTYSFLVFLILFGSIWTWYGNRGVLAQGRYLFPIIFPLVLIAFIGLKEFGIRVFKREKMLIVAFGVFNIAVNLYVILFKMIPLYYLTISGPMS